jgi:hypothetical protein
LIASELKQSLQKLLKIFIDCVTQCLEHLSIHPSTPNNKLSWLFSMWGPALYAIFVSPLFGTVDLSAFADGTFIFRWNGPLAMLMINMEETLYAITDGDIDLSIAYLLSQHEIILKVKVT